MPDNKCFDLRAGEYDKTAGVSDEEDTYPFAGYKDVLGTIQKTVMGKTMKRYVIMPVSATDWQAFGWRN
ncbi:MAG: hypothetical protein IJM50_01510 [Lachnospiraceae bacterium]|nr:hypothetical protein [Lachnospiraceae bacterium]